MTYRASIKCKPKPNSNWRSCADEAFAKIRSGFNILTLFSSLGAKLCKTWNRKRILERPLKSYTKYETCFKNNVNLSVLAKNLLLATLLSGLKQHNISSAFDVRILIAHTTYTPLWPVQTKFVWAHPLWYTPAMLPRKDWVSISDKIKIKKRSIANNGNWPEHKQTRSIVNWRVCSSKKTDKTQLEYLWKIRKFSGLHFARKQAQYRFEKTKGFRVKDFCADNSKNVSVWKNWRSGKRQSLHRQLVYYLY